MSGDDNDQAKERMYVAHQQFQYAQERWNETGDNYSALQAQTAGVIIAFLSVFSSLDANSEVVLKNLYLLSILSLATSLAFGLINHHLIQRMWIGITKKDLAIYKVYRRAFEKDLSFDVAKETAKAVNGLSSETESSPDWPWRFQTIFLFAGILLIFTGMILKLYL